MGRYWGEMRLRRAHEPTTSTEIFAWLLCTRLRGVIRLSYASSGQEHGLVQSIQEHRVEHEGYCCSARIGVRGRLGAVRKTTRPQLLGCHAPAARLLQRNLG